jgi:hypothetical protein
LKKRKTWQTNFQHGVLVEVKGSALVEGQIYGAIHIEDVDGLRLEREFSFLSGKLVGKDLYNGTANVFSHALTLPQRRLLLYELSKMSRRWLKKSRRSLAYCNHIRRQDEA